MSEPMQERVTVAREFPVQLTEGGDGRTVEARIVPYNTPAEVADPPHFRPYLESWLPGCFERQTRAADKVKVLVNFEHDQGLRGVVGHGIALDDRPDALYGVFRIHENPDGDKALGLIHEGILDGISLEAVVMRSRRGDGLVERVRAHLDKVALCRTAAFTEARVLAVREGQPDDDDGEGEPRPEPVPEPEPDEPAVPAVQREPVLREDITLRLEALGYEPVTRAVTHQPWDGSAARFTDEQYQRSCLIDRGGDSPPKTRCSLPVLEPNGDVNANALGAAAGRLNQLANVTLAQKAAAARKLLRYYRQAKMQPPPSVTALAAR